MSIAQVACQSSARMVSILYKSHPVRNVGHSNRSIRMRTAIYTRRSELGERDHNWSIESQERQVRDVCTREGDSIVAV